MNKGDNTDSKLIGEQCYNWRFGKLTAAPQGNQLYD